jgi:hypothetical protein
VRVDRNLLTIAAVLTGTVVVAIGSATAANGKLPPPPPPLLHHVQWSIDIQRITQGLEHDFSANVDYDKIAGKDVLVRVQPFVDSPFLLADLIPTSESCTVQQISVLIIGLEFPIYNGKVQTFSADEVPSQGAELRSSREYFEDPATAHFDCWVPGSAVASPGRYHFTFSAITQGVTKVVTHDVGNALFVFSAPLNILLTPWIRPPENPYFLPLSASLYAHYARVEQQLDRTLPLPTGVSGLNDDGLHPSSAGLHVALQTPFFCPADNDEWALCDAQTRAQGSEAIDYWNATAASLDSQDGRHRDRFATGTTMGAISSLFGGQSCWPGESVAGSDIGPGFDDNSAFILAQEMLHCLGLVDPSSPNSNPTNQRHSKNNTIGLNLFGNLGSMVNFLNHNDYNPAYSLMFPTFNPNGDANTNLLEGYEWNELRSKLLTLLSKDPQYLFTSGQLDIDFTADRAGSAAGLVYAGRATTGGVATTVPPASSDYSLAFLDAAGAVIASQPVDVSFANSVHDDMEPELPFRNVDLHVAVPDGAVSWKLLHDGSPQLIQPLATAAPKITRVAAVPDPANRVIHLRWSATGASFYRLFYQRSPKTPQMLIANGLTDSTFDALTDFLPPAPHGIFTLVASNGNLTTEQTMEEEVSSAVSVSISGPPPGTVVLAGEPITFEALAQLGAEPLDEAKYKWSIDGHVIREVGEGATLTRALTVGPHTVAVQVTSRHPHTNTTATLDVDVSPPPP